MAAPERSGDDGLPAESSEGGRAAGARATGQNPEPRTRTQAGSIHAGREDQEHPDARTTGATPRVEEQAATATAGVRQNDSANLSSIGMRCSVAPYDKLRNDA